MKKILTLILILIVLTFASCSPNSEKDNSYDVVIYGATSAGVIAAIQVLANVLFLLNRGSILVD